MKKYLLIKRYNRRVQFVDTNSGSGYTEEEVHNALDRWVDEFFIGIRDRVRRFDDIDIAVMRATHVKPCAWYEGAGWYYTNTTPEELIYKYGSDHFSYSLTRIDIEVFDNTDYWIDKLKEELLGKECEYTTSSDKPIKAKFTSFINFHPIIHVCLDSNEHSNIPIFLPLRLRQCEQMLSRNGIRLNTGSGTWEQITF